MTKTIDATFSVAFVTLVALQILEWFLLGTVSQLNINTFLLLAVTNAHMQIDGLKKATQGGEHD